MRCKAGDLVYVEHAAVDGSGKHRCVCHVGLIFTVRHLYTIPTMPGRFFWDCPLKPRCSHFVGGVRGFDDELLKPIRPPGVEKTTTVDEKSPTHLEVT